MKKIQLHTPEGIIERDLTLEELDVEAEATLNQPGLKALIEVIEDKFSMTRGTLRQVVKNKMKGTI